MKKVIILGATSGIGLEVAKLLWAEGVEIGIAGRRKQILEEIAASMGDRVTTKVIDVTSEDADSELMHLAEMMGGVDTIFISSGIGSQNKMLQADIEIATTQTNVVGFTRMIGAAFRYFADRGGGHIGVISSIAGTKGLGAAPAYSATKRFQNTYVQCLAQLSSMRKANVTFTDIRPGFVDTDLLRSGSYPMLLKPQRVARLIVKALKRRKRVAVIDWRYRILVALWRLIPRFIWERLNITN